jgi:N-acetylmuramoyl-L-alanine amidase
MIYTLLAFSLFFSGSFSDVWAEVRMAMISVNDLNVREGPGLHYPVIKRLNKGETYEVIDQKNDWLKLRFNDNESGWVFLRYVNETTKELKTVVSTVDKLRIRKEPNAQSAIVGYLNRGQKAEVLDRKKDWTKIKYESFTGWVFTSYLAPDNNVHTSVGTVTANRLNVRAEPSEKAKIIGKLNRGDTVNVIKQENNWCQVVFHNQTAGWIHSTYISFQPYNISEPASYVKILSDGTNIRVSPSLHAGVLAKANSGETYRVLNKNGSWYKIELSNKTSGYIAEWVVSLVSNRRITNMIKNKTIILDAGHGGKDSGAIGKNGTLEKTMTLQTALLLQKKLEKAGANVILTRTDDVFISLSNRLKSVFEYPADAFISIHYDSSSDPTANGMTIYYYDNERDKPLAKSLYSQLSTISTMKHRGIRFGDFHVLRENHRPSVLLELGYLSNPKEEQLISSSLYQEQVADAISESLKEYFFQ